MQALGDIWLGVVLGNSCMIRCRGDYKPRANINVLWLSFLHPFRRAGGRVVPDGSLPNCKPAFDSRSAQLVYFCNSFCLIENCEPYRADPLKSCLRLNEMGMSYKKDPCVQICDCRF